MADRSARVTAADCRGQCLLGSERHGLEGQLAGDLAAFATDVAPHSSVAVDLSAEPPDLLKAVCGQAQVLLRSGGDRGRARTCRGDIRDCGSGSPLCLYLPRSEHIGKNGINVL